MGHTLTQDSSRQQGTDGFRDLESTLVVKRVLKSDITDPVGQKALHHIFGNMTN